MENTLKQLQKHLDPQERHDPNVSGLLRRSYLEITPRIICKDGFSLSVQASEFTYCSPRDNEGPWTRVEVGFPSQKDDLLMEYAEDASIPTGTVYGYVPIEVVAEVIERHGGFEEDSDAGD